MAEDCWKAHIGAGLHVTDASVNKLLGGIFDELELPVATDGHRRVLAVLACPRG
ncbi:hypothetical protein [Actinoplanes sp. NPDC020271]|uniref:hypothetical protein n=1 Tax=Actinoplanes sp. NPDC020271 TaxID=3363896 RepID=UPI003789A700